MVAVGGTPANRRWTLAISSQMKTSLWSSIGGGGKTRNHCVNVTPKWPTTHIYLDANGDIDTREGSGTDTDRLKQCTTDTAKP